MTIITVMIMDFLLSLAGEGTTSYELPSGLPEISYTRIAGDAGPGRDSCYPRISYAIQVAEALGQKKLISGVEARGNLMEIYTNPETGAWTLILVLPHGLACEIGNGTDFEIEPDPHQG